MSITSTPFLHTCIEICTVVSISVSSLSKGPTKTASQKPFLFPPPQGLCNVLVYLPSPFMTYKTPMSKNLDVCLSVHHCICVEKKNQLDATEWFIALIICSTCFGHFRSSRLCVITAYGARCFGCCLLEVRCRAAGYASGMRDVARATSLIPKHSRLPCT